MNFKDIESWINNYPIDANHVCKREIKENGMYVRFGLVGGIGFDFTLLIKPNGMLDGHRSKGISEQASRFANELIDYLDR